MEMDDYCLVENETRRMMAAAPHRPEGHCALGVACLSLDPLAKALEAVQNADRIDPARAPTHYNIGSTLRMDEIIAEQCAEPRSHKFQPQISIALI